MKIEYGCSRMVLLVGPYAIKLPNLKYRYPACVRGLLDNLNERLEWACFCDCVDGWGAEMKRLLCPVLWADRFGLCVVMRRAQPLSREWNCPVVFEWLAGRFNTTGYGRCPAEKKPDSFGILNNEIVAIDYA